MVIQRTCHRFQVLQELEPTWELSGEVGESVDMSTEPSRDICGINKKEYLEYAFNPLVLTCPNPHSDLLQRHDGIAHYSIISVDQFIHFYVSHFYSIKIQK